MYKMLIFLKKNQDSEEMANYFEKNTLNNLRKASGKEIKLADIEGAAFMEEKFYKYCELKVDSKDELDTIMASVDGKKFSKEIQNYMPHISIFYANFKS